MPRSSDFAGDHGCGSAQKSQKGCLRSCSAGLHGVSLCIVYASTSGHTEYVVDVLANIFKKDDVVKMTIKRAEEATEEDFTSSDILLLASGTWNTGGREGQLNPYMYTLLNKTAKDVDLAGKKCLMVSLGDDRYKYTARATEHLATFINSHGGHLLVPPLVIVNDPYGQEAMIEKWSEKVLSKLSA